MSADVTAPEITYEEAKALAADQDPAVREALAQRTDIEPEILYFLAKDDSENVRKSVALNSAAPKQTITLLATDESDDVRVSVVEKMAVLAPELDHESHTKLWEATNDALYVLANDQMVNVRQAMAEALKDVEGAPQDLIKQLALDADIMVSAPVLEYSPVLSDLDLLEIIEQGNVTENLIAISKRTGVSGTVSDAIVESDDSIAIAELLHNNSAQIREETLDDLITRAPDFDLWHAPLVNRPTLPDRAPQRLALFIADHLIETLKARDDLEPKVLEEVRALVEGRLKTEASYASGQNNVFDFLDEPLPMVLINRLASSGGLNASVIMNALQEEDHRFVLASIVSLSNVEEDVVKRIFAERSPKGVVSLVWKASLPVMFIVNLQQRVARIAPQEVLEPKLKGVHQEKKSFPLTPKEMDWNLSFFKDLVDRDHGLDA